MSDRFDELLSGVVDTATQAAKAPGAEAARRRGRQRRNRRRSAACALSVALLGVVGGVAAISLGGSGHTPAVSTTGTATATATGPSTAPSASASGSGPASASPTKPSGGISTSAGTSASAGSQHTTTVPSPGTYVAAGWLTAHQLPYGTGYQGSWEPASNLAGTPMSGSSLVLRENPPVETCNDSMSSGNGMSAVATGADGQQFRMYDSQGIPVAGTAIAAYIREQVLFFPSTGKAQSAFDTLPADFAACKAQMTGYNPTSGAQDIGSIQQTLDQDDAQCWSTLVTGTAATSSGTLDHTCFVRQGTLIAALQVSVNEVARFSDLDFTSIDSSLVADLHQALTAY